jgi:hypothetical protein
MASMKRIPDNFFSFFKICSVGAGACKNNTTHQYLFKYIIYSLQKKICLLIWPILFFFFSVVMHEANTYIFVGMFRYKLLKI